MVKGITKCLVMVWEGSFLLCYPFSCRNQVPIALGTIHIDMLIKLATQEKLGKLSWKHCWKRGAVLTGAVMQ